MPAWAIVVIGILIVAAMGASVSYVTVLSNPTGPADLGASFQWTTRIDNHGLGSGGTIHATGTIYNDGNSPGSAWEIVDVFHNGTIRASYVIWHGVIYARGSVYVEWSKHVDPLNITTDRILMYMALD